MKDFSERCIGIEKIKVIAIILIVFNHVVLTLGGAQSIRNLLRE